MEPVEYEKLARSVYWRLYDVLFYIARDGKPNQVTLDDARAALCQMQYVHGAVEDLQELDKMAKRHIDNTSGPV